MANCKCCGKPVRIANVYHSACAEKLIDTVTQKMCDDYCRLARDPDISQEDLFDYYCSSCPLGKLEVLK